MKILLLGATGDVGRATLDQAVQRGHVITAVARRPDALVAGASNQITQVALDVLEMQEDLADLAGNHDVIISALRPIEGQEPLLVPMTRAALGAASAADIPILVTGGAALLKLADGSGHTVLSAPDFLPDSVRPIAEACAAQDALLDTRPDVAWTCLRPPAMLHDGPRKGRYTWGQDTLVIDSEGQSEISFADFGSALIDLAEQSSRPNRRLTVAWGMAA